MRRLPEVEPESAIDSKGMHKVVAEVEARRVVHLGMRAGGRPSPRGRNSSDVPVVSPVGGAFNGLPRSGER
jgi:hypothetical protein